MSDQANAGGNPIAATKKPVQKSWNRKTVADMTATYENVITVRTSSDTDCWITGIVALSPSLLACADHTNKKIKLVDVQEKKVVSELTLTGAPWDLTVVSTNRLAVTVPDDKKIQFVTFNSSENSLSMGDSITVNGACRGIAYSKDRLAVTYTSPEKIEILTMEGQVIQPILVDMYGKSLFNLPDYITVDSEGSCIFVSDLQKDTITKLSFTGKVLDTYIDTNIAGPEGLFFCEDGSLLACGIKRKSAIVITPRNRKLKVLIGEDVGDKPYAICHIEDSGLLILSNYRTDELRCFKVGL